MATNAANKESIKPEAKTESGEHVEENSTHIVQTFDLEEENELQESVSGEHVEENSNYIVKVFDLEVENELCIEMGGNSVVTIKLLSGLAEIYGTEMELFKEYSLLKHSAISAFTWHGCMILLKGNPEAAFVIKETAMILQTIVHAQLESQRLRAEATDKKGPVIFVVGPNDEDKSTLCRLLVNYAVRMGRHPVYVDLDVGQTSNSLPGTVSVLTAEKPADIVTGFIDHAVQVYQYGERSAWQNIEFYYLLLQRLGQTIRLDPEKKNEDVQTSGMIISGCDWSRSEIMQHGYNSITLVAMHFNIDVICVLEEEDLYVQLKDSMPSSVQTVFLPKTGGVERNQYVKSDSREARIRDYFYGPTNELQPFSFEVKYSDIQVFEVVARPGKRYTHFLSDIKKDEVKLMSVKLESKLVNKVFGISSADELHDDIMYLPVIGFICIVEVNLETETITVLCPLPGPLPKKILLKSETILKKLQ